MRIYNVNTTDMNMRFVKAAVIGVPGAIAAGVVYGIFAWIVPVEFSIVMIGVGWCIGQMVRKVGRGVLPRFQVLAAVLCVLAVLVGDMTAIYSPGILAIPSYWGQGVKTALILMSPGNVSGMLRLLFRAFAVVTAYNNAVIF